METQYVSYLKIEGNYEEIGRQVARKTSDRSAALPAPEYFTEGELGEAIELYETYCPGLIKELEGYASAWGISLKDIAYTWMTYLTPHCSGLIVEGSLMKDGHTRLIRNYEFSIADAKGNGSLVETMDGELSFEQISSKSDKKYLCGTNHIVIPSFRKFEPFAMRNSMVRLQALESFMEGKKNMEEDEVKEFFLTKYPEGMSAYYYDDWFGTIKSVVMDTSNLSFQICWFGQEENGWEEYRIGTSFKEQTLEKRYERKQADAAFFHKLYL